MISISRIILLCFVFFFCYSQMDTQSDAVEIANDTRQPSPSESNRLLDGNEEPSVAKIDDSHDCNEQRDKANEDKVDIATESKNEATTEAKGQAASDEYAQHVEYNDKGVAIYTDPATKCKYEFDNQSNQWVSLKQNASEQSGDPYENEHYRWCHDTNQWVLKDQSAAVASAASVTENEFYKWDAEKQQWIPKMTGQEFSTDFKDGEHTYTDQDGVVFFWDTEKNAWFPRIDDDFMAVYQMNYGFVDNTSVSTEKETVEKSEATAETSATEDTANDDAKPAVGGKRKPAAPSNYIVVRRVLFTYKQFLNSF